MFIVGLTGGIATGKSTVSKILAEKYGVPVIDSDLVARKVVEAGQKAWTKIRETFGNDVIQDDGTINRELLGRIVFSDEQKRLLLNSITHPEIRKHICWLLLRYFFQGYQLVVVELPLLFETRVWTNYVHKIIVVTCEDEVQLQRLCHRNKLGEPEAIQRISSQMSNREKCAMADFVVETSGSAEDAEHQVDKIYLKICQSRMHWKIRFLASLLGVCTITVIGKILSFLLTK